MLEKELERSRFAMQWGGTLGLVAHPFYYFVWTVLLPQPYDNLLLRLSAAVVCIPLVLQKRWPKRLTAYLVPYWHFCLIYVLPFTCTFLAIKNTFSTMWMMTEVMIIFILALCIDSPLLLLACVVAGIAIGSIAAFATTASPLILTPTTEANLALLPIVIICSMVFSRVAQKKRIFIEKNKILQALAGSIAHEMRNPLGQIKASFNGIERVLPIPATTQPIQTFSTQQLKDLYQYIAVGESAIKRGSQVISMILDEVAAKPVDTANFAYLHAAQITQKAINEYGYETEGERHKISIVQQRDFLFRGDETLTIFVLFNLIKNALYYFKLKPFAHITITINQPTITVRDTGPGIPAERLPHLFESFQTSGKQGGTGLGLAYCKRVMQTFGGDIICRSVLDEYTEFTLRFPEVTQSTWAAYEKSVIDKARPIFKDKNILIVDDDESLRLMTQAVLSYLGAFIEQAADGQVALQKLAQAPYDLIVMDLNMPVLDGYATAEKIRAGVVPGYEHIPIVAYTTESAYMTQVKTQKVGINSFISKPCEHLVLIQAVEQALLRPLPAHDKHHAISSQPLSGKTILVADDSESNRDILRYPLQDWGATVLEAEHGNAVLEQLASGITCDAILLDMRMPGLDGREVTQAIRTCTSAYQTIPILAVTAEMDEEGMQAAYLAGINDCISKPVDTNILYEKLTNQLNKAPSSHVQRLTQTDAQAGVSNPATSATHDAELFDRERLNTCITRGLFKHGENAAYIRQAKECLANLETSIARQDFKNMQDALHFLKGSSANIGAIALSQLVAEIEKQTLEGNLPSADEWFGKIKNVHMQTLSALQGYLNKATPSTEEKTPDNGVDYLISQEFF